MLERVAAWFLNTYVAEYVGNVLKDQLSIGLLRGKQYSSHYEAGVCETMGKGVSVPDYHAQPVDRNAMVIWIFIY